MKPVAPIQRPRREQEGGFALLLVFMFAAAVAFAIYQELPRAAFESARDKEQLLMDRGKQYERAIEVYYAENKRYPPELKDLEDTNQKRYLRRRYKDPLTGQDEWRLIHTNGSFLTDSLVKKPPAQNAGNGAPGGSQVGGGPLGSNTMNTAPAPAVSDTPGAPPAVNAAAQRRPSDRGFPQPLGNGGNPPGANPLEGGPFGVNPAAYDPNDPRTWPPITLAPLNAQPGQPNALRPGQQPNAQIMAGQVGAGQVPAGQVGGGQPQVNAGQGFSAAFGPQMGAPNLGNTTPAGPNQTQQAIPDPFNQNQLNPNQLNPNQLNPNQLNPNQLNPNQQNPNQQNRFNPSQQNQFNPNQQNQFNSNQQNLFNPNGFNQNQSGVNQGGQAVQQGNPPFPQPMLGGGQQPQVGGPNAAAGGNAALQAINDQLFRPNQGGAPLPGATASPGIAGVASKHEGASIKTYRERTKYQEWEFVFDASAKNPTQPASPGQNPLGQNPTGGQNPLGQGQPGQVQPGQAQPGMTNPFSQPNPFSPQGGTPGTPGR